MKNYIETSAGKRTFIRNYMRSMQEVLISEVNKMPPEWDGREIREYIKLAFESEARNILDAKRKREFNNTRRILPFQY